MWLHEHFSHRNRRCPAKPRLARCCHQPRPKLVGGSTITPDGFEARIVAVDDDHAMLRVVERALRRRFDMQTFGSAEAALDALAADPSIADVLLTDLHMHGMTGFDLLAEVRASYPTVPVIIMTGRATVDAAVEALRLGAYDFLVKPFEASQALPTAVSRAIAYRSLITINRDLRRRLDVRDGFEGIVGHAPKMRQLFDVISSVAPTTATALISGESGTGKELVARAIHDRSHRSTGRFVPLNCGALGETLLESELFGHVKGAFTGASTSRVGLFEEASGGTLFLDEVGELSPSTQVRLLRVLQEREVRPVGSNETRRVDVRLLAATHRDLAVEVAEGRFRQDLYYRLKVVTLLVPALRDRVDDIPLLAQHFVAKVSERLGKHVESIEADAMAALQRHPWPGNVRELENAIEHAIVLGSGSSLRSADLPMTAATDNDVARPPSEEAVLPLTDAKEAFVRGYLRDVLARAEGSVAEASRLAGMDRSNFRRLLKRYPD